MQLTIVPFEPDASRGAEQRVATPESPGETARHARISELLQRVEHASQCIEALQRVGGWECNCAGGCVHNRQRVDVARGDGDAIG